MTKNGTILIYNYTIIDTTFAHQKYLREFGIKKSENRTEAELGASKEG